MVGGGGRGGGRRRRAKVSGDWSDSNRTEADADVFESVRTEKNYV